ncbi:hypothetical protein N8616_01470 [Verrucomicrobia bacterium]|nr:hypothetical protein [Verrucomicrobiota bacterium]MDA7533011.1 hypothetical protein [Verrucomicrobiota bacterium]
MSSALANIVEQANRSNIALALVTCHIELDDQKHYNQIGFYGSSGKFQGLHSKPLFGGSPPKNLQVEIKGIRVIGLTCNEI